MLVKTVVCKDVFNNEYTHDLEELTQTIRVYAVIIENNKILLTRQWDGYSLVGGGVEKGEGIEDALIREVKEETGLAIIPNKMFYNTFRFFQRKEGTKPVQAFQFYFNHKIISGEINNNTITESEKSYTNGSAEWVDLNNIENIIFRHSVDLKVIIDEYYKNTFINTIKDISAGKLWIRAMKEVYHNGNPIKDGEQNLKELLNVLIAVENPIIIDEEIKKFGDVSMIEWMDNNFLSLNPVNDWGYSYGQRMYKFNGDYNQFEKIVEKLKKNPESKSATICFAHPGNDNKHSPCIITLDFKIRNNKLNANAFFRSQDAGKKFYADIICMGKIMNLVSTEINVPVGELNIFISSLHIYEKDFGRVLEIINSPITPYII